MLFSLLWLLQVIDGDGDDSGGNSTGQGLASRARTGDWTLR
jgi:hypothetical protein